MDVSAVAQSNSTANTARTKLADDFDTFLTLLTAQLQHQDPLSPMETTDFMQQLAQFTSVEQSVQTNENLETLIGLSQDNANSAAVSYLGKDVVLDTGTAGLKDGQAEWSYNIGSSAANTSLSVVDASGTIVYATTGETTTGSHTFTWDGIGSYGQQYPDGEYSLVVNATTASEGNVATSTAVKGRVTGVSTDDGNPAIVVSGAKYPLTNITSIEEPAQTQDL